MTGERDPSEQDERSGAGITASDVGIEQPFVDRAVTAVADWRRREIVKYFRDTGAETATVAELALYVGAYEPDGTGGADRRHDDLVEALTDTHLPHLVDAGVVDFDPRSGTVRYEGQATVEKWLDEIEAVDRRIEREAK